MSNAEQPADRRSVGDDLPSWPIEVGDAIALPAAQLLKVVEGLSGQQYYDSRTFDQRPIHELDAPARPATHFVVYGEYLGPHDHHPDDTYFGPNPHAIAGEGTSIKVRVIPEEGRATTYIIPKLAVIGGCLLTNAVKRPPGIYQ